jgi:predicted PurR-regulated permease PerM
MPTRPAERVRTVALVLIAACLVGGAMYALGTILTPLLVAVFLFFLLRPVPELIARLRAPVWVIYPILFVLLGLVIFMIGVLVQSNARAFAERVPSYRQRVNDFADQVARWTNSADEQGHVDWEHAAFNELFHLPWPDLVKMAVGSTLGFIEWAFLVLFYLLFLFLEAQKLPGRIRRAYPAQTAEKALSVGQNIIDGINSYLRVKTIVSLGLGAGVGLLGFLFSLDFWPLWAVVAFLTNYITYVGSVASLLPPIALAYLQFPSPVAATIFSALLIANRVVWIDFVEIRMSGQHLDVSPLLLLLALAGFGWLWGVVGMVLAVPLVTTVKIVLANFESTKPFAILASEE